MRDIEWTIPKRYLSLTLYDGRVKKTDKKVLSRLTAFNHIVGDISATVSGASAEANFTIYGLKVDTMAYLSTSYSTWVVNQIQNEIKLDIGYENNHAVMFNGYIIEAVPNFSNENYSIKLKCLGMFPSMLNEIESLSFAGNHKVKEIAGAIASKLGFTLMTGNIDDYTINDYSVSNQPLVNHLRILSEMSRLDCYIDNERVVVKKSGEALKALSTFKANAKNMIGTPRPTNEGTIVKVRMNPSLRSGQAVTIDSKKFPQMKQAKYNIQTIGTSFNTYGEDWSNELTLVSEYLYRE